MKTARKWLSAVMFGLLLLMIGYGVYFRIALLPSIRHIEPASAETIPAELQNDVVVDVPDWDHGKLSVKQISRPVTGGKDAIRTAVETLIANAPEFPKGTKLLEVKLSKGTAALNFNSKLQSGMSSDTEEAIIMSLRKTCGEIKSVQRIKLLIENKEIDSLGGHSDDVKTVMDVTH